MDQRGCEESGRSVVDFKGKEILHGEEKPSSFSVADVQHSAAVGKQNFETKIVSQTPEKTNEPLHDKFGGRGVKHLEKYNTMIELFDSMTCSLRLLGLCKKSLTFKNVSTQVEVLTKRKFSCRHLAQMKYLLPEAIQINDILVHNKKTLCMEPDLKIALLFGVIEGHCQQSDFRALHQIFASRLTDFFTIHPETCDIPEATLPEPFSQRIEAALGNKAAEFPEELGSAGGKRWTSSSEQPPMAPLELPPDSFETELLSTSSLLHPSFSRHFSQKSVTTEAEKAIDSKSPAYVSFATSDNLMTSKDVKSKQQIEVPDSCCKSTNSNPPIQLLSPQCVSSGACESPLQKLVSPADSLMIETPVQVTPKRSMPSCDNKIKSMAIQNCTSSYKPAKRSLDFSHLEGERSALHSSGIGADNHNFLNDVIPQDIEVGCDKEGKEIGSPALIENVENKLASLTDDGKMSWSELVVDKDMSVCLPDLVASIHRIFQTVNCSSITKQELVHKIIMNNFDIIERREVEEQIELLEKLVPEWITKMLLPSGDILYSIKKVSDLALVQARVVSG